MPLPLLLATLLHLSATDSVRTDRDIRESVLRNSADVRRCYEREGLRRDAGLHGSLELELTILPTGAVDSVAVSSVALSSRAGIQEVTACVTAAARHWTFERGPFAVETVVFPFVLRPVQPAPSAPAASST